MAVQLLKNDLSEELYSYFQCCPEIGLDCELMGLNVHRDRLCLVQIGSENGPTVLIQIDEKKGAPKLKALLENRDILKIFHFARMDLLFLRYRLGIKTESVFCTKIASRIARTYTDRHGLKELVKELCGETLDKTYQSSDWGRSELTKDQINYAADDVRFLFQAKRTLVAMLERESRLELARCSFIYLTTRIDLDYLGYDDIFSH